MKLNRLLTTAGLAFAVCTQSLHAENFPISQDASANTRKRTILSTGGKAKTLGISKSSIAYFAFDVGTSGIDPTTVAAARLTLFFPSVTKPGKISLHKLDAAFSESGGAAPAPGVAPFKEITISVADSRQYMIIDLTTQVKDWLTTPASDFGIAITGDTAVSCVIASKEGAGSGHPPALELDLAIASGGVGTAQIADGAVTSPKLASDLTLAGVTTGTFAGSFNGNATNVTGIVSIANGGTGSAVQNFVDLTTNQNIAGNKNFTSNLGIGIAAPTYPLDILHGGSTGARVKSSASFSAFDIDAQNGDAALRFAKDGVNQWNIRNRPADDYLEIFELGGGGSRVVIQDGTGNVGIGETVSPSYKLDVLHGGATGIRSRSDSTFSLIDIDAANGDAALRFAKAGVNQWNTRNRPADDYYEIFELGGGGSRFVIQDGTGNVGIGETTNPTYRLDVLHGGATGIRSRSSSTFSLVDIDGANGDAALRFAKAGVNQWNIRNNPATDDLQFFELGGGGERMRIENTTGNVVVNGTLSKGGGAFKIDHPLDPENKYLYHSFVESPDMMNIYNGNVVTNANGKAIVSLPAYFEALNMEFRYQLTVIGVFAQAIISKEVKDNQFEITTDQPNIKVSWQVTGIRHDAFANQNRIPNEVPKEAGAKGKYLHPAAFAKPASKSIGFVEAKEGKVSSSIDDAPAAEVKAAPPTEGGSLDQPPADSKPARAVISGGVDSTVQ